MHLIELVDALFKERNNVVCFSIIDPLHGIESIWDDVKKIHQEIEDTENTLQSHFNWFSGGNKRKRAARYVPIAKEELYMALKDEVIV